MRIRMLKSWHWRGAMLREGQVLTMTPNACKVLLDSGVAVEDDDIITTTQDRSAIETTEQPRSRRGTRRKKSVTRNR